MNMTLFVKNGELLEVINILLFYIIWLICLIYFKMLLKITIKLFRVSISEPVNVSLINWDFLLYLVSCDLPHSNWFI